MHRSPVSLISRWLEEATPNWYGTCFARPTAERVRSDEQRQGEKYAGSDWRSPMLAEMGAENPRTPSGDPGDSQQHKIFYGEREVSLGVVSLPSRRTAAAFLAPTKAGDMQIVLSIGATGNGERERIQRCATQVAGARAVHVCSGEKLVPPERVTELEAGSGGLYIPWLIDDRSGLLYLGLEDPRALRVTEADYDTECGLRAQWLAIVAAVLSVESAATSGSAASHERTYGMIGSTPSMRAVFEQIRKLALEDYAVMIRGESGTGKELVANALHNESARKAAKFVAINCSAIPQARWDAELFGSVKGGYTDSIDRKGLFREANGGTVFLDEVAELPMPVQAHFLRVLNDKKVRPVGSDTEIRCDVRLLCATHRNLEEMVDSGAFRPDLYYRLAGGRIDLPPLRERIADIAPLTDALLELLARDQPIRVTAAARTVLSSFTWPGNVRQLENFLRRALTDRSAPSTLDASDLPAELHTATRAPTMPKGAEGDAKANAAQKLNDKHLKLFLSGFFERMARALESNASWHDALLNALVDTDARGRPPLWIAAARARINVPEDARGTLLNKLSVDEGAALVDLVEGSMNTTRTLEAYGRCISTILRGSSHGVNDLVKQVLDADKARLTHTTRTAVAYSELPKTKEG